MKILITGSSGFLGSALVESLLENAENHLILLQRRTINSNKIKRHKCNCKIIKYNENYDIEELVIKANPDIIIHTACSYGRKGESIIQMLDVNLKLGLSILQAIKRSPKKVVFINTNTVLAKNMNLYALSKNNFAEWGKMISSESDGKIKFINVLLQHMYGPYDDVGKFPTYIIKSCLNNVAEINLTNGLQLRDFIYIEDVVSAYRLLVDRADEVESESDVEIGSGEALNIREFVQAIHRITNSKTKLNFGILPCRENEQMEYKANTDKIKSLGWTPKFNLEQGLKKTIEQELKR